jgi:hypothetical protein
MHVNTYPCAIAKSGTMFRRSIVLDVVGLVVTVSKPSSLVGIHAEMSLTRLIVDIQSNHNG